MIAVKTAETPRTQSNHDPARDFSQATRCRHDGPGNPHARQVALLNARFATAPSRPPAWESSPADRVIALPQARSLRAVSWPVSSILAGHNKHRRNPDHVAPLRAPVSHKLRRSRSGSSLSLGSVWRWRRPRSRRQAAVTKGRRARRTSSRK